MGMEAYGPKLDIGAVVTKRRRSRAVTFQLVVDAFPGGSGQPRYKILKYHRLFDKPQGSTSFKCEYYDGLVLGDNENNWVDYDTTQYRVKGHLDEENHFIHTAFGTYAVDINKYQEVHGVGPDGIKSDDLFHETGGGGDGRRIMVEEVGEGSGKLADGMVRLTCSNDTRSFVETASRMAEAIVEGVWVPVNVIESSV